MVGFKVSFDYDFNPGDRFFGAGYQSWTTANEFTAGDIEMDITPLARGWLEHVAAFSADTEITGRYLKSGSRAFDYLHLYSQW